MPYGVVLKDILKDEHPTLNIERPTSNEKTNTPYRIFNTYFCFFSAYTCSLSSRSYVCFFIFPHSTFDVGRSMFSFSRLALMPSLPPPGEGNFLTFYKTINHCRIYLKRESCTSARGFPAKGFSCLFNSRAISFRKGEASGFNLVPKRRRF